MGFGFSYLRSFAAILAWCCVCLFVYGDSVIQVTQDRLKLMLLQPQLLGVRITDCNWAIPLNQRSHPPVCIGRIVFSPGFSSQGSWREGLTDCWEATPPLNSCRGRRPTEGAVPGPPALLTPHRPRSPQQRAVQSQSAFASAAVGHHAGPEIPPPGSARLVCARPPGPCSSGTRSFLVCGSQGVVIPGALTFFAVSQGHGRGRFLRSLCCSRTPPRTPLKYLAGGVTQKAPPRL